MQDPSLYTQINAQAAHEPSQPQFPEQEHLKCPRCDSANTKFCYYNNYNLSQPRHFCKSCKRYWTKGGALRNIPVGGAPRKNAKRSSSASSASPAAAKRPATSAPETASNDHDKDHGESSNNNNDETVLLPKGENFVGQFGNFLEASGSFSSLLGSSGGQFGNFLDGSGLQMNDHFGGDQGPGRIMDPNVLDSGSINHNSDDGFLNIHGGDGGDAGGGGETGWSGGSNGWPDLAIYTPGSTFL